MASAPNAASPAEPLPPPPTASASATAQDAPAPRAYTHVTDTQKALPVLAFAGGLLFTGASAYLGYNMSIRRANKAAQEAAVQAAKKSEGAEAGSSARAVARVRVEELSTRELMATELPKGGGRAGILAVKALAYGTALCFGAAVIVTAGTCAYLGVTDLNGFARKMEEIMPKVRRRVEELVSPTLQTVSEGAKQTVSKVSPPAPTTSTAAGTHPEDYLTSRDRQLLREIQQFVEAEEARMAGGIQTTTPAKPLQ